MHARRAAVATSRTAAAPPIPHIGMRWPSDPSSPDSQAIPVGPRSFARHAHQRGSPARSLSTAQPHASESIRGARSTATLTGTASLPVRMTQLTWVEEREAFPPEHCSNGTPQPLRSTRNVHLGYLVSVLSGRAQLRAPAPLRNSDGERTKKAMLQVAFFICGVILQTF